MVGLCARGCLAGVTEHLVPRSLKWEPGRDFLPERSGLIAPVRSLHDQSGCLENLDACANTGGICANQPVVVHSSARQIRRAVMLPQHRNDLENEEVARMYQKRQVQGIRGF